MKSLVIEQYDIKYRRVYGIYYKTFLVNENKIKILLMILYKNAVSKLTLRSFEMR